MSAPTQIGARRLPRYLLEEQARIIEAARDFGLDFFETLFEIVPYYQMSEIAAYEGFPIRYPHYRFGMEYERFRKSDEYGLSRIYELVINNNPGVAYLLEGNSLVDQKLVMTHVYGHVDFFKNNRLFGITDQGRDPLTGEPIRKWIDTMANHASIVRRWSDVIGRDRVEEFLDLCLRLDNLIDPHHAYERPNARDLESEPDAEELTRLPVTREYMDPYINPPEYLEAERARIEAARFAEQRQPERPTRDILGFLIEHAELPRWQAELLTIVRKEAYYFYPQLETKIMNEGWATYVHTKLLTSGLLDTSEIVDYADRTASVLERSPRSINPYQLGLALFRHIERRWDRGQFGPEYEACGSAAEREAWDRQTGLGREKLFEVRAVHSDLTFIDEFLTEDFVREEQLYTFGFNRRFGRDEIKSRDFQTVKEKILKRLKNGGSPMISIVDENLHLRGELLLEHEHHGDDLDMSWGKAALEALQKIWKRPVELFTRADGKEVRLRFDGAEHIRTAR